MNHGGSPQFAEDKDHFIYCADGASREVDVLAKFSRGNGCPAQCAHGDRKWTWTQKVNGGSATVIYEEFLPPGTTQSEKQFLIQGAGDTVTITCTVGATVPGICEEDDPKKEYEHSGTHLGNSRSCTFKLWRLDMDVVGEEPTFPFYSLYNIEFAKSVTMEGTLVGATEIAAQGGAHPWKWKSLIGFQELQAMEDSKTWTGTMVAHTLFQATATVENECDSNFTDSTIGTIQVVPNIRRPDWRMVDVSASIEPVEDWLSDDPTAFPGLANGDRLGLNNNAINKYRVTVDQVVTPIYVDLSITDPNNYSPGVPHDYDDFTSKVTQISNGPNAGLFFNSNTTIFNVDRVALLNHWTTPEGTWPVGVPNVNPSDGSPASFGNWLAIYTAGQQSCECASPSGHGASSESDIRHKSNYWHEGRGCPDSDNWESLGHQMLMKKAIESSPETHDALWQADLLYSDSEFGLRTADETVRRSVSAALTIASAGLHGGYLNQNPQRHNFYGFVWLFNGAAWSSPNQLW